MFNSFKSVSSNNNNNFKKISDFDINSNIKPNLNNGNNNGNFYEKTKRVNFDDFNTIGENPFKINMFDKNSTLNNSRKKYTKYGNMKEGYNLSPKNIYSPWKNYNINNTIKSEKNYEIKTTSTRDFYLKSSNLKKFMVYFQ